MPITLASKATKKKATALPESIENEININLNEGIRSWEIPEEWEFYVDDIVDNAEAAGWTCKFIKKTSPHDPEVLMKFIKFFIK